MLQSDVWELRHRNAFQAWHMEQMDVRAEISVRMTSRLRIWAASWSSSFSEVSGGARQLKYVEQFLAEIWHFWIETPNFYKQVLTNLILIWETKPVGQKLGDTSFTYGGCAHVRLCNACHYMYNRHAAVTEWIKKGAQKNCCCGIQGEFNVNATCSSNVSCWHWKPAIFLILRNERWTTKAKVNLVRFFTVFEQK